MKILDIFKAQFLKGNKSVLLAFFFLFFVPCSLFASHFRYGSISWQNPTGNVVSFKVSEAWRGDAFGAFPSVGQIINIGADGILNFGDGTTGQIILTVTSINPSENWFYGEFSTSHTYSSAATRTVFTESCCRISNLVNNGDGSFRVQTTVNVGSGNSSPISSLVPVVDLPVNNSAATFTLPATDPNGSPLSFRLSTSAEASEAGFGDFIQPSGLSINNSGVVTFNTIGKSVGQLYNAQFMIGDGSVLTALDFIIRISVSGSGTGTPPFFATPTPANGQVFNVTAGQTVSFNIFARDNDAGNTVTLSVAGAPIGSTFSPSLPATGNPVSSTFIWTTTLANIGSFVLNFNAQDNTLQSANTSVTINVTSGCANCYYSKATGDLHNVSTWGINPDGSGANPPDFSAGKTFNLANRAVNYTMTANWTVGGAIVNPSGAQLQLNGFTLSEAGISGGGTITGSTTSNLIVTGSTAHTLSFTIGNINFRSLNSLTLNRANATDAVAIGVGDPLNIIGVLAVNTGTLTTNNALVLKSTATNTARVAPVIAGGTIAGNVTVERYIPARRAWRLLAAPVAGFQSINAAWQEGTTTFSSNPNPNPGFGTHVTQSVSNGADGLDFNTAIAMSSLKMYQNSTNAWVPVLNTNTTPVNSNAWFTFVRGDRSINMGYNTVAPNNTTLRSQGPLRTGDQTFAIATTGLTTIANPYASPINFATIAANNPNISNSFTVVDPKLGSTGAFVTVSYNTVTSTYDVTPAAASPINQLIQSGQGFLVQSNGAGGNVVIKESDKSATAAADVFRVVSSNNSKGLRINLQALEDNNEVVLDEAFSSYDEAYSNQVDNLDAIKAVNQDENLAIVTDGKDLIVDRRKMVDVNDVVQLKLWNTTERNYILDFNPVNLSSANIPAHIEDSYLKTSTPIDLTRETKIPFIVTSDAASKDPNRFKVVFSKIPESILTLGKGAIKVVPNPVSGGIVSVVLENQPIGRYNVELIDNSGRTVYKSNITHQQNSTTYPLKLNSTVGKGLYKLKVTQGEMVKTIQVLIN